MPTKRTYRVKNDLAYDLYIELKNGESYIIKSDDWTEYIIKDGMVTIVGGTETSDCMMKLDTISHLRVT